ncbi:MAG: hypothetical protein FWD91_04510 [Treponema sp.]|nr:hypothetical protein [Treponema sp.]
MKISDKKEFAKARGFLWRVSPALLMIILFSGFVAQRVVYDRYDFPNQIIAPEHYVILAVIIGVMAIATIAFPYRFWIHAAFCLLWGLVRIADGELTTPLLLHFFGYVFLFRMGFFKSHEVLKLSSGMLLLMGAIASQYRLATGVFGSRILHFSLIFLLLFFVTVILRPEIHLIRKSRREPVLRLKASRFTEKDAEILRKILEGKKYEAIALEEGKSIPTFKRYVRRLFDMLQVSDRVSFISKYMNYTIILEDDEETPPL